MSESRFLEDMSRAFEAQYPRKEGWLVYKTDDYSMRPWLAMLPAFLRSKAPEATKREAICIAQTWQSGQEDRRCFTSSPVRRAGSGLSDDGWSGDIDLEWKGSPVCVRRFTMVFRDHTRPYALIATKDEHALSDLWHRLKEFDRRLSLSPRLMQVAGEPARKRPTASWDDLVLPGGMRDDIRSAVEAFLSSKKQFKELGLPYRRGFLFSGPPGCGKTLAIRAIAARAKARIVYLPLKHDTDDYRIKEAFDQARNLAPAVLILEDLDHLVKGEEVSMSFLLNLMDGINPIEGVLVIATTNHPEKLDSALLQRPSRFDKVWHFPLPAFEERLELIRRRARGLFSEQALDGAARHSQGFTMAYVQEVVVSAFLTAMHAKRRPSDQDLADSLRKLREQFSAGFKPDAALQAPAKLGFAATDGL